MLESDIVTNMNLTHQQRKIRRHQIVEDAKTLKDAVSYQHMVKTLSAKYGLCEAYISQIIKRDVSIKDLKNRINLKIAEEACVLNGTITSTHLYDLLATKYDLPLSRIKNILKQNGINIKKASRMKKDIEHKIVEYIKEGKSVEDIAKIFQCSRQNIYRYYGRICHTEYLPIFSKRKAKQEYISKVEPDVIKLYEQGHSLDNIAKELNIPRYAVSHIVHQSDPLKIKNYQTKSYSNRRAAWLSIIGDLFDPNLTIKDVAVKYDKHPSNICLLIKECREYNIPIPDRIDGRTGIIKTQTQGG